MSWWLLAGGLGGLIVLVGLRDLLQKKHAILRNFPLVGHGRYWIESLGPELRQYIVSSNDEERPFSRDQRRWVYASAKQENQYFGFGTDNDLELTPNHLILRHSPFPMTMPHPGDTDYDAAYPLACAKQLGGARQRRLAFRPPSIVNVSAMSFGSLSSRAVEAINRGAAIADCLHNTGEGGISPHHDHGGGLIWQLGTGYFGCRDERGRFSLERVVEAVDRYAVRAIEIKLSQGAKPGLGGVLPGKKVTPEIAAIRGIRVGETCISPARHTAFSDVDSLLDFVEGLAQATGLPVGIKSAVGQLDFWRQLAEQMATGARGVDFITVDGGEGGTGAAPRTFTDHVALPFKLGFSEVYRIFAERDLADRVVWVGSGKLGLPESALFGMALGCDLVHVAREAMLAVGCIQAQQCHTGRCPTGVATQSAWLMRGLDPTDKSARLANYIIALRKELMQLSRACGVSHPSAVSLSRFAIVDDRLGKRNAAEQFGYEESWGVVAPPVAPSPLQDAGN